MISQINLKLTYKIVLLLLAIFNCEAQFHFETDKSKIKIPFELSNNLIIIDVEVNDVVLKMILDTGSERNIVFSFPEKDSITFYNPRKVKIKGAGIGEYLEAYLSEKNSIKIKEYVNPNTEILLVTDQNIGLINKLGIPINGILGADFFKDNIVGINYQNEIITVFNSTTKAFNRKSKKYKSLPIQLKKDRPYIDLAIHLKQQQLAINLLVDTGLSDALWLFENDSIKCTSAYFTDFLGRGLSGDIKGKKARVKSLIIDDFQFHNALVSYPDAASKATLEIEEGRLGSLGGGITKRFNWFFHYNKSRVYIKENSLAKHPFNYNMSGIEVQHSGIEWVAEIKRDNTTASNVNAKQFLFDNEKDKYNLIYSLKPVFEIYSVRENSPAFFAGLHVGDTIISINGKRAYHYNIQKITNLFQSEEGKRIELQVKRGNAILKFEFHLQKIL